MNPTLPARITASIPGLTCHCLPVQRVVVIGNSGSGKTSLATRLANRLDLAHVELDGLFHQRGWTALADSAFRDAVDLALPGDGRWVADGNYGTVRDIVWGRADTIVWLDLPRHLVTARIVRRSVRRGLRRTELWNGNRERVRNLLSINPERSVIAWSVRQHRVYRREYAGLPRDERWAHARFVRLRSNDAAEQWLRRQP
jgi:adenylate kinase family enzyme